MLRPIAALTFLVSALSLVVTCCGGNKPLPRGGCRENADCKEEYSSCQPAGSNTGGCGETDLPDECSADGDCKSGEICDFPPNPGCFDDYRACRAPCAAADCLFPKKCAASGHCELSKCSQDADCGPDLSCHESGQCVPRTCSSDADCGGFCLWNEQCYPSAGECLADE